MTARCPLYPRKQTFAAATGMSALCQKADIHRASLDHYVARRARSFVSSRAPPRAGSRNEQCPNFLTSGRQDDGLAGRLRVEEPVGFLGLL